MTSLSQLESVEVLGLYGDRRLSVAFNSERPTYIFGRNGVGKSTMLKMVEMLFDPNRWYELVTTNTFDFDEIRVTMRDSQCITFQKGIGSTGRANRSDSISRVKVSLSSFFEREIVCDITELIDFEILDSRRGRAVSWTARLSAPSHFMRRNEDKSEYWERILEKYRRGSGQNPQQLAKICDYLENYEVMFIGTDRESHVFSGVDDDSGRALVASKKRSKALQRDLDNMIKQVQAQQSLENMDAESFVTVHQSRLREIGVAPENSPVEERLASQLQKIRDIETEYVRLGILKEPSSKTSPASSEPLGEYEDEINRIKETAYYVRLQQLKLFDYAYKRLMLFNELCADRFFLKKVIISRGRYEITSQKEGSDASPELEFEHLSSGEKQFLLLIHTMLIKASVEKRKKSIFLVDEPELSLQGDWLDSFSRDIAGIQDRLQAQMIFASHNPIVADFSDLVQLQVELS